MAANRRNISAARNGERLAGAAFAILVQAGLLAMLVLSRAPATAPERLARELTLILPRLKALPPPPARTQQQPASSLQAHVPIVPLPPNPTAPFATPPDASTLGQSLFGCAPENYASLTPAQRALCTRPSDGVAVQQAPRQVGVRPESEDEAHWAAELAARKSIRVPCTRVENQAAGTSALMVNPLCANDELEALIKKLR